jgi:hypothetical protein
MYSKFFFMKVCTQSYIKQTQAVLPRKAKNIQTIHKHYIYIWESTELYKKPTGFQNSNVHSNIRMTNSTSTPLTEGCSSLTKNGAQR